LGVFDVFQVPYSILQREHAGLIAAAAERGPLPAELYDEIKRRLASVKP
jgi:hypothetical protein